MRRAVALCCTLLLIACAQQDQQAESENPPATPPTISLADVAGTWNMETAAMGSDSVLNTSQLVATGSMDGWVLTLPNRDPIPVRVLAVDGDSIMTEYGPFPSVQREGLMVTVNAVSRLREGTLISRLTAHYQTSEPDSVVTLRARGTRVQ
jgi:hypothetical protein